MYVILCLSPCSISSFESTATMNATFAHPAKYLILNRLANLCILLTTQFSPSLTTMENMRRVIKFPKLFFQDSSMKNIRDKEKLDRFGPNSKSKWRIDALMSSNPATELLLQDATWSLMNKRKKILKEKLFILNCSA